MIAKEGGVTRWSQLWTPGHVLNQLIAEEKGVLMNVDLNLIFKNYF